MGIKAFLYSVLFLAPIAAQSQTYTFECVAGGRLSGDSCDICPNTIVESRSFNGLVIYRDSSFYRWIDQPYSIRIKPGGIIEYWEHAVNPYNERVTIPLDLTGFATIEGMADSTWCNSPGPHRYQELHFDSIGVDFARVRITGSNTGFALRGGSGIDFGFDSDTLDIESTGGGGAGLANNGLSMSGDTVQLGGALIKNTAINGAFDLKIGNTTALDTFSVNAARINLDLAGGRFLHTSGGGGGGGSYENTALGYLAGASLSGSGYANTLIGRKAGTALNGTTPLANSNVIVGYGAGEAATTTSYATIVGTAAASALTTASNVTMIGYHTGRLQTGSFVTGIGEKALENNTASNGNTAVGYSALGGTTSGNYSTAVGFEAGNALTTSGKGTFLGYFAGHLATDEENTYIGYRAGGGAAGAASYNTAVGSDAGLSITSGNTNSFFGRYSGTSTTTGSGNVFIGKNAAEINTTGSNNIVLGRNIGLSSATVSNELNIGDAIYGTALYGTSKIGIEVAAPARTIDVNGEARIRDLTTDTPDRIIGADSDGDIARVYLSGLSMVSGVLTAVDSSTTNEIQTYAHTGTTSYTNTLSNGGGAFTLQAGTGITLSHTAGTTTFASSITQYTDENAQDAVGSILVDGTTIDFTYNDGTPSITAEVIDNSVSNAKIRQSAGLSVIGRSANSTGNVADITAAADGNVLRRSGTTLGFGTVATAGIADQAVTYVKIQNAAANNVLLGNNNGAGTSYEEIDVAAAQTMLGFVDGTGANQRVTYWTDANTVSGKAAFLYDAANDRLTISCTAPGLGAGAAILNLANVGTDGTGEFIRMAGSIDGNMLAGMYNSSTTADDNTIFTVSQAGNSAGDPVLQLQVSGSGGNTTSLGVDNSDANKFKITPNGNLPGANANASLVGTNDSPPKWGVNKDAPGFTFDVGGMARDEMYHGINVSWGSGDVSFGLGAGTSPTFTSMTGTHNYVRLQFSTGTSPTANNAIFTVTRKSGYEFATKGFTVICAGNANTANEITKFYMNSDNGVQYTITANGTLTASTEYVLYMTSSGY